MGGEQKLLRVWNHYTKTLKRKKAQDTEPFYLNEKKNCTSNKVKMSVYEK